jgi:hypothetical protein
MKLTIVSALLLVLIAACQPATPATQELPTVAVLPSATPTESIPATTTLEATPMPATATAGPGIPIEASATDVQTNTAIPSRTPRRVTPTNTVAPTQAAIGTATQAVLEAPRFVTFTPAPAGAQLPPGAPQQFADVVINEAQFQEEVNLKLLTYPNLESAVVDFVPSGIDVRLTAYDGTGLVSGNVLVAIILSGDFATITISSITTDTSPTSQGYIDVATGDFFVMMVETLDTILKQRLGPEQNLQNIVVTDTEMQISLLVPQ